MESSPDSDVRVVCLVFAQIVGLAIKEVPGLDSSSVTYTMQLCNSESRETCASADLLQLQAR